MNVYFLPIGISTAVVFKNNMGAKNVALSYVFFF